MINYFAKRALKRGDRLLNRSKGLFELSTPKQDPPMTTGVVPGTRSTSHAHRCCYLFASSSGPIFTTCRFTHVHVRMAEPRAAARAHTPFSPRAFSDRCVSALVTPKHSPPLTTPGTQNGVSTGVEGQQQQQREWSMQEENDWLRAVGCILPHARLLAS